ncbi:TIGR01457 family HAD-type hydrolase [Halobacillus sp. Marseille-Q1614]|uniref:TIGR01457 family HAD-type hydrolase n=1 Tax=Halobacillus sp. Marseille-Q1614 TaxID=2709134 RepID=UPI00156D6AA2|nr:TIGR01457 family HAD-type hydrolase [Halobacillus sp. Marseille-Q1614]
MKSYSAYLIDLDGTMYRGIEPIDGAAEFVQRLNVKSIPYLFVTNNSSMVPKELADKLNNMGIQASKDNVFTSSMATAKYIDSKKPGANVFIIGENGLWQALEDQNLKPVKEEADFVTIGIDRKISYEKLAMACLEIRNGAELVSTNKDAAIPTERGMVPGNGAITSVLSVSTGVTPTFVGKPEAILMEQAVEMLGFPKEDILMVGDNYDTDIMAGIKAGIDTLMVETGVSTRDGIKHLNKQPTHHVKNLSDWKI